MSLSKLWDYALAAQSLNQSNNRTVKQPETAVVKQSITQSSYERLPSDVHWQIFSFTDLSDLSSFHRINQSTHEILDELIGESIGQAIEQSIDPSSLKKEYHTAKPLIDFLAYFHSINPSIHESIRQTFNQKSHNRSVKLIKNFQNQKPRIFQSISQSNPFLRSIYRKKHFTLSQCLRFHDLLINIGLKIPIYLINLSIIRFFVPTLIDFPLRLIDPILIDRSVFGLIGYSVLSTWIDLSHQIVQRAIKEQANNQTENQSHDQDEQSINQLSDSDDDDEIELFEDQINRMNNETNHHDMDLSLQRAILRFHEHRLMERNSQTNNRTNNQTHNQSNSQTNNQTNNPPTPHMSDSAWRALVDRVRIQMGKEHGSRLVDCLFDCLIDCLSAIVSEFNYRFFFIFLFFFGCFFFTFFFRFFLFFDGMRLMIEGLIPLIPMLGLIRSFITQPDNQQDTFISLIGRLIDRVNRPSVIVSLRTIGVGVTLALTNGPRWKIALKRVIDQVVLPVMDAAMFRTIRIRRPISQSNNQSNNQSSSYSIFGQWEEASPFLLPLIESHFSPSAEALHESINQSINRSLDVSSSTSINQSINRSLSHLVIDHSASINRSLLTTLYQAISQTINRESLIRVLLFPSIAFRSFVFLLMTPNRMDQVARTVKQSISQSIVQTPNKMVHLLQATNRSFSRSIFLFFRVFARVLRGYFFPTLVLMKSFHRSINRLMRSVRLFSINQSMHHFRRLLLPYLPSPKSAHRLFAISLFMSQLYARDDSQALSSNQSINQSINQSNDNGMSIVRFLHSWFLSICYLRIGLRFGLPSAAVAHAIFNMTATVTRWILIHTQ